MTSSKRTRRARTPAITNVVAGTYEGTREIVEAVVKESTHVASWRPVRAVAVMAMAGEVVERHEWMATAEFTDWFNDFRRNRRTLVQEQIGMATSRRGAILDGARITKVEALAIAHYRAGLQPPVLPGDTEGFRTWFDAWFGGPMVMNKVLELSRTYINERLSGYAVTSNGRAARLPDVGLIRALDWVLRVGPFSPYGRRLPGTAFPGQKTEDSQ